MEYLETKIICLKVSADKIMNTSFVLALSKNEVISIKLPTNIENYKLANLISPAFLLEVDLVKTKKNWVLRNILGYEQIIEVKDYKTLINLSNLVKITTKFLQEGESVQILDFVKNALAGAGKNIDLMEFEAELMVKLGFTSRQDWNYEKLAAKNVATKGKTENDLRVD